MSNIDLKDVAFYGMFVILLFIIPWMVVKASYDKRVKFDISDLWTFHDRIDLLRTMMLLAFWAHTSSMILWTLAKQITTADWLAYAGVWVTPVIVRMVGHAFGNNGQTPAPETAAQPGAAQQPPTGVSSTTQ